MKNYDMLWLKDDRWLEGEGLAVKVKKDAPKEIRDSFENYLKQLKEENASNH